MRWVDVALRQEEELRAAYALRDEIAEENRELRDLLARLLFAVTSLRDLDLIELARAEIEQRFPDDEEGRLAA